MVWVWAEEKFSEYKQPGMVPVGKSIDLPRVNEDEVA